MEQEKMIEQEMYRIAIEFIPHKYPKGWGGVAVIRSDDNLYFTSVSIETANISVELCIEVGAMCEAHKYDVCATHCL